MNDRQFDPDSLCADIPTAGQPPRPSGGALPENVYEVEILRNLDGTATLNSATQIGRYPSELRSASFPFDGPPVLTLAPRDAAMLGLYRLIEGLRWHSVDLEALAKDGAPQARVSVHPLTRVFLDWPRSEQESMPAQTALITSVEDAVFEPSGRGARILEETADRFYPETLLRYLGHDQIIPLRLIFWTAHKDQRRGLEARVAQLLAAERHDDKCGRRIILPEYFSRVIRYTIQSTSRPDAEEGARGNEWVLDVSVLAEVPHVELVWSPGRVDTVGISSVVSVAGSGQDPVG
jgi:hypothetical protein